MGVKPKDIDYAVEVESYDRMLTELKKMGCKIFLEYPEFLTIRGKLGKEAVDFTMCRVDGKYTDGRRPDSVVPGTIYDDLARCDFTANAIAKDSDGKYIDPYGGIADIKTKTLRCVGKATDRLSEDGLRILRAFRFSLCLGFTFDKELEDTLMNAELYPILKKISCDRKMAELNKMFRHNTVKTIQFLNRYPSSLLDAIFCGDLKLMDTTKSFR